jgi:hypothetical protein
MPPMVTQPAPSRRIVLYGAEGCHLCESARAVVVAHLAARASAGRARAELVEVDIHDDDRLLRAFLERIPVLVAGDARLDLATSPARIRAFLDAALAGVAP